MDEEEKGLRDVFAAAALIAIYAAHDNGTLVANTREAFDIADLMIQERKRRGG